MDAENDKYFVKFSIFQHMTISDKCVILSLDKNYYEREKAWLFLIMDCKIEAIASFWKSIMKENKTISYYNSNAKEFVFGTVSVDFAFTQEKFMKRLPKGAMILDFGCGSGRDSKYFISQGYQVEAIDGSIELCKLASEYAGIEVKHMLFQELAETGKYDGIWACSSILHLSENELAEVMRKMVIALKENGIIYTSFKYGTFAGERNGRYFTDMTEEVFADFIKQIENIMIVEQWVTSDVRTKRGDEKWLNLILQKI